MFYKCFTVFETYEPNICQAVAAVGAADAEETIGYGDTHTVGCGARQVAHFLPIVFIEQIDVSVEFLCAAFGCRSVGEVASTGHHDLSVDDAGVGC